ncbi:TolC family protein [Lutibacter sp.]|uniref:TolC family protein n=1 Tax=Lutibacter sp. TaxID=1925666 RepID=UPI001A1917A9|nr:TolC family protein [Lutibacter sp.]MBI9041408.1 TolC family protein [Lutibacter sp.]
MKHIKFALFLWITTASISAVFSQELLSKKEAITLALENNYGILMAKNNIKIAENNASVLNSGFLPKITASSGINYSNNNTELTSQSGTTSKTDNAEVTSYNGSLALNYTLFDGFGRAYNYKKLKESYNLSELEAKAIVENSLLQIFSLYYEVARLTEDTKNILETLAISKQRLTRANYAFEYGQNTKLQLLNAEVDVNNDSIRYINLQRLLSNSKRDLNLLLGRNVTTDFGVDTNISFNQLFNFQTVLKKAKAYNVDIQKLDKSIVLNDLDIKINQSDLFPTLNLNSSYGFNKYNNDATFTYAEQLSKGLSAGISLNWSVFDGGSTKTRIKNSKIIADNLQIQKEQINNTIERSIANAIEIYNNALFILQAEEKNVETNLHNFSRTEEQFKLGQITSIEFRQAQINLLNAQSSLNQAKYDAKNAELLILQLSGDLLNIEF